MKSMRVVPEFAVAAQIMLTVLAAMLSCVAGARAENLEQMNMAAVAQFGGTCNALALQGHYAYVGEGASLVIYDTTRPDQPSPLGRVRLPQIVNDVAIAGNLACVTYAESNDPYAILQVIDISNPATPTLRGRRMIAGSAPVVAMAGSRAVWGVMRTKASPANPLETIDLANPDQPQCLGSLMLNYAAQKLTIAGALIYVVDGYDGLVIVDASDPAAPVRIGNYDTQYEATDLAIRDQVLYLVADGGLMLIDVTHPAAPALIDKYGALTSLIHLTITDHWAYVADQKTRLNVLDLSVPTSPSLVAQVSLSRSACDVATTAGLVYVAEGASGLQPVDVSTPASPVAGRPLGALGFVSRVAWAGGQTCVAAGESSLQVIGLGDPQGPASLGYFQAPATIHDLACSGSLVCLAEGAHGLQVLDISQPSSPTLRGELLLPAGSPAAVSIADHYAYLADTKGFKVIDLSDPTSPTVKGSYVPSSTWYPRGIAVSGPYVCVASHNAYSIICATMLNVSNPARPYPFYSQAKYYNTTPDVAFIGKLACLAESSTGLHVVDWSDSRSPLVRGALATVGQPTGVAAQDQHVFLTDNRLGMMAVDVTDPDQPVPVGFTSIPGKAGDVDVRNDRVCVAAGTGGLQIVDYRLVTPTPTPYPTPRPAPAPAPRFELLSQFGGATQLVKVDGARAYINESNNLVALDVTTPSQPRRLGRLALDARPTALCPAGDRLYLTAGAAGLQVIDTRDPGHLARLGAYPTGGAARDVAVANSTAYVAADTSGILMLDVRQAGAPVLLGRYPTTGAAVGVALADGGLLCVADEDNGLLVLDVSDPAHPTLKGHLIPSYYRYGVNIRVKDQTAYLQTRQTLYVIDLLYPDNPRELLSHSTHCTYGGLAVRGGTIYYTLHGDGLYIQPSTGQSTRVVTGDGQGVDVAGSLVYVAAGSYGLRIIDVTNPSAPVEMSQQSTLGSIGGIKVLGRRAYIADGYNGLKIVDLNNLAEPALIGHWPTSSIAFDVDVRPDQPDLAYLACYAQGLCVVDLSDPTSPTTLTSQCYGTSSVAYNVRVIGDTIYYGMGNNCGVYRFSRAAGLQLCSLCGGGMEVAQDDAGLIYTAHPLRIIDMTDPWLPRTVADTSKNYSFVSGQSVVAGHGFACVMGVNSFYLYDTRIPRITRLLTSIETTNAITDLTLVGDTLFVVESGVGLLVYDVTDPTQPQLRATYGLPTGTSACLTVADGLIYLGEGTGNLKVLRYIDPAAQNSTGDHWALYR